MNASPAAPDWGHYYGIRSLWSEIRPGLWMGGTADDDTVADARERVMKWHGFDIEGDAAITPDHFDTVVTLYAWARPVDWFVEELRFAIYDDALGDEREALDELVEWTHRRWKTGKRVLVRCQAGLSRSGLVTALVLMRDGMESQAAIDLIRKRRTPRALTTNPSYVEYLHERGRRAA